MTASVGWSRDTWNSGAWNTSPDALAVINGISSNALLNNAVVTASAPFSINGLFANITIGQVNAGSSVFIDTDSFELNSFLGNVSTGEGREITITTAGELTTDLNLGFGWGREEWNVGAWNESLGFVFTGNGDVFSITTAGQLTASGNGVTATASAPITITGEQLDTSQGEETVTGTAIFDITGEDLVTATVDSFAVLADGSITINTPTFEANVELSDSTVIGTASFLNIVGTQSTVFTGNVIANSENFISVTTAGQANITVNTTNLSTVNIIDVTGNSITTFISNVTANSENFLSISGNQANISVSTLKFWDPIKPTITEEWTNIN